MTLTAEKLQQLIDATIVTLNEKRTERAQLFEQWKTERDALNNRAGISKRDILKLKEKAREVERLTKEEGGSQQDADAARRPYEQQARAAEVEATVRTNEAQEELQALSRRIDVELVEELAKLEARLELYQEMKAKIEESPSP